MTLIEINKDLFDMDCSLVHCISSDFALGAGIAATFRKIGVRDELIKNFQQNYWKGHGYCCPVLQNNKIIYNLVTKKFCYEKPTYENLKEALIDLKKYVNIEIVEHNNHNIAMPYIGCGLDKLSWDKVKPIIEDIFSDLDVNIIVCYIDKKA